MNFWDKIISLVRIIAQLSDNQTYPFQAGTIEIVSEDVLIISYHNDKPLEEEDVIAAKNLRNQLIGNRPYYPIIDMRKGFVTFSKSAKKWAAENRESAGIRIMDVLLVANWGMKIEAQLYQRLFKPINPTKIVLSFEEAMATIEKHRKVISEA